MSSRAVLAVVAVVVGGVAAVLAVGAIDEPVVSSKGSSRDAVAAFGARWETWRRSSLSFAETTERTSGDQRLTETVEISQRFPDRIVRTGGDVSARIGARLIGCSDATPSAPAVCVDNGGYDPERELRLELDEITDLTGGASPRYRLSDLGGGCYRLRHLVSEFRPRWGDRADVCFDETGLAVSETTVTGPLTVTVERMAIAADVTDDDFVLPAPVTGRN